MWAQTVAGRCPRKRLGYSCAGGITFWIYFMAMPRSTYEALRGQDLLLSDDFFGNSSVRNLGRLTVATQPDPTCAGA